MSAMTMTVDELRGRRAIAECSMKTLYRRLARSGLRPCGGVGRGMVFRVADVLRAEERAIVKSEKGKVKSGAAVEADHGHCVSHDAGAGEVWSGAFPSAACDPSPQGLAWRRGTCLLSKQKRGRQGY